MQKHISDVVEKVLLSAPADQSEEEIDGTFVLGVNGEDYDPESHHLISNASCTTNALSPIAMVLDEAFGIEDGDMTTIHAYTSDQRLHDSPHNDPRRARSAANNLIPTSTGAAKAIGLVLPNLKGKLDGISVRVPVPTGSMIDLKVRLTEQVTREDINEALRLASENGLNGIMDWTDKPLVLSDFIGDPHSSIVDSLMTSVTGDISRVIAWYDNEWGYANRLAELTRMVALKMLDVEEDELEN